MTELSAGVIRSWIAAAEEELSQLTAESERLHRLIAQARTQLGLMYELLATVTGQTEDRASEHSPREKSVRERVVDGVIEILKDHDQPMRIQDIHSEFLRREFPLPGSGTPGNIAAHLVDKSTFVRSKRGVYGLTEWAVPRSNQ